VIYSCVAPTKLWLAGLAKQNSDKYQSPNPDKKQQRQQQLNNTKV
jgi:hypothetical protein